MNRVLVSHPHGAFFANAAAAGLERRGMLAAYWTGVGFPEATPLQPVLEPLLARRGELRNRVVHGVEARHLRPLAPVELAARATAKLAARLGRRTPTTYDAVFLSHDAAVAVLPWPRGVDAIYAYEDGALRTFARARRLGLRRIWDLPIPHWATIERMWRDEAERWPGAMGEKPRVEPAWKQNHKDSELAEADLISVASSFTRASLEPMQPRAPVIVTPYGFPTDQFEPKAEPPRGPFTVLAVGSQDVRKGTTYLLEAWKRAGLRDARLLLVGAMRLTPGFLGPYRGLYEHVPHVPRAELGRYYREADVLLFPTLGDGFGMVIQEAMCSGTPVVTTRCGGGPECITSGEDGWLVPERDIDALVDHLRMLAGARDRCFEVGKRARKRAERWTVRDAGDAIAEALARA